MIRKWLRHRRDLKLIRAIHLATRPQTCQQVWTPDSSLLEDLRRVRQMLHEASEGLDRYSEPSGD
jgi:hypothetical protein